MSIQDEQQRWEKQLERYKGESDPKHKLNYYFTDDKNGKDVSGDSIFIKSYFRLKEKIDAGMLPQCESHILLVGFSIQPLIHSILALRAEKIILIYSEESKAKCREILSWVKKVQKYLNNRHKFNFSGRSDWSKKESLYQIDSSNPAAIYKRLIQVVEQESKTIDLNKIAIDITGGKKTMVAGAFFAASTKNIGTYYVDYEKFDGDNPEPGTEYLRKLPNVLTLNKHLESKVAPPKELDEWIPEDLK